MEELNSKKYHEDCINNLKSWIQIDSTYDESTVSKAAPFGKGVAKALEYIATLAEKDGFNVDRCDGYCTEISFGEGDLVAIYAHADVVPVSGNWKFPPFSGHIENDIMYGRGTSDDKGPAMAAYYALKMLRDNNLINGYKVTLVIGGNEESGSKCLEYYFHTLKKTYPKYGFTPDGEFPLIYGEKSITGYNVTLEKKFDNILSLQGGVVINSVIDECHATLKEMISEEKIKAYTSLNGLRYQITNNELVFFGKAMHGSLPELGINAALHMLIFLGKEFGYEELVKTGYNYLDGLGKNMNLYIDSPLLHGTSYNVGLMNYDGNKLTYSVNFRYGESVDYNLVQEKLLAMNLGSIEFYPAGENLLFDPKEKFIQTLLSCYQEETGDMVTQPMAIGGGTYAKESKNTVAFGSHFPGREDHIHEANEKIHLEDLLSSINIYAKAIMRLGKLGE